MRYGGESIVKIEANGFEDCVNITQLTVPDSVTIVGNYAFQGCKSLEKLFFPTHSNKSAHMLSKTAKSFPT